MMGPDYFSPPQQYVQRFKCKEDGGRGTFCLPTFFPFEAAEGR